MLGANAQTFTPAGGSALPNGEVGQPYAGTTINFTVPTTVNLNTSVLGDPISVPGVPLPLPNPNLDVDATVTDVTWAVEGLPAGLTATCSASPCTYVAGATGTITISGTPTQGGTFTIDITSLTNGSATLPAPISQTIAFPQAVPSVLDETGYTMNVAGGGNSIAEANELFSLGFYPNPTEGDATLDVNSLEAGVANIEIYSITGSLVSSVSETIRVGANRIAIDMNAVPTGIYMVKATINGEQALIRTQKM